MAAGAPHDWIQNLGGSIGYSTPVATGAAIACPDRKVICMVGDGSAMYTLQSLWTQAREGLNVVTIVFANRIYQILRGEFDGVGAGEPGQRTLRLPHGTIVSTDDHLGKSVYPDIVVHQREIPNNLLAIEIRKAGNHQPLEHDQHKLRALTDPHLWFAYWIGVHLALGKKQVT